MPCAVRWQIGTISSEFQTVSTHPEEVGFSVAVPNDRFGHAAETSVKLTGKNGIYFTLPANCAGEAGVMPIDLEK